jgi:hypothetical protein
MLTFKEFVSELAREEVLLSPAEVDDLTRRFGGKVLQMGNLQGDGSMLVSVDCIIEAVRSLESRTLMEAAEILNNQQMVSLLQSGETFVRLVGEAREQKLRGMIQDFQNEPDPGKSRRQWKHIETELFGVNYSD